MKKIMLAALFLLGSAVYASAQFIGGNPLPTYSAGVSGFSNSSAGDIYCISGSSTKTVYVKGVHISAIASGAVADPVTGVKRSTADSGGTPTSVTLVPNDSANPAGTATITAYGTAPTTGTLVGITRSQVIAIPTTSATVGVAPVEFTFTTHWDQPITLHGSAEQFCITVPSTAGGQWNISSEHSEGPIVTYPIQ